MSERLPSGLLVGALLRRVNDAGGIGMVLARGDAEAGAILVVTLEKGVNSGVYERGIGPQGTIQLVRVGPEDIVNTMEITEYWRRRRSRDPDLWVIELDIASAERFAAETIMAG